MAAMRPTRIPASEWRKLTEAEQRQRIRESTVTDLKSLDPDLRAMIHDMAKLRPQPTTPAA